MAVALALAATVPLPILALPATATTAVSTQALPACTNPPPPGSTGFTPQQLRQRYGVQPLLDSGFTGQGQTAVLLEFGQSVDLPALDQWRSCLGVSGPPVTQKGILGSKVPTPPSPCGDAPLPACFGEAQGDAYSIITGAPGLDRLYILVSDQNELTVLPDIVDRLRSGELTDGRRPDVVSLSFGSCQPEWKDSVVEDAETALQLLAQSGTWFFKAAGDAGPSDCSKHPVCDASLAGPAMGYPAASPWVTAIGGTEVRTRTPLGRGRVWNNHTDNPSSPTSCAAGAGGLTEFARPAYQRALPGELVVPRRGLPDVSALAGEPGYLNLSSSGDWFANGGTSLASPLYAGAFASVRSKLRADGVAPPVLLNDALYAIAAHPTLYAAAFNDIQFRDNRIYSSVDCCDAGTGFDLASGLGEIRIDVVATLLSSTPPVPPTTAPSTTIRRASVPAATIRRASVPAATITAIPTFTG